MNPNETRKIVFTFERTEYNVLPCSYSEDIANESGYVELGGYQSSIVHDGQYMQFFFEVAGRSLQANYSLDSSVIVDGWKIFARDKWHFEGSVNTRYDPFTGAGLYYYFWLNDVACDSVPSPTGFDRWYFQATFDKPSGGFTGFKNVPANDGTGYGIASFSDAFDILLHFRYPSDILWNYYASVGWGMDGGYLVFDNDQILTNDSTNVLEWKVSSVPYDLLGTGVKDGETPPVANAGPDQNVVTGKLLTLDGSSSFDPDGDLISFLWTFVEVPQGSSVTDSSLSDTASAKPTFVPDLNGIYRLNLVVNDGSLNSAPDEVAIIAATSNVAPNANAGLDQSVFKGSTVYLDGSGSNDPDNGPSPLSYLWSFFTIPNGSMLTDSDITGKGQPYATFIPDVNGAYELKLTVSDGDLSSEDTVQALATTPNVPPNANAGADISIYLGGNAILDGSTSNDPDQSPQPLLTYLWSFVSIPTGSTLNNNAILGRNTGSPSFTPDITGTFVLELMVSDGQDYAYDNVTVTVTMMPIPPSKPDLSGLWSNVTNVGPSKKKEYKVSGSFTVNNTGSVTANGVIVDIYLSNDNAFGADDSLIKTIKYSSIKAGASKSTTISFNTSTYPGGKYLIGVIDPNNAVNESNESNNTASAVIPDVPYPYPYQLSDISLFGKGNPIASFSSLILVFGLVFGQIIFHQRRKK